MEKRLADAFKPSRRKAYRAVMALPEVGKIAGKLTRERKLIVVSPDSDVPPKVAHDLFMTRPNKNNFVIVNGPPPGSSTSRSTSAGSTRAQRSSLVSWKITLTTPTSRRRKPPPSST